MSFSIDRALTIARREYQTTIRRKAFLFTIIGMPAYFAFVTFMSVKPEISDRLDALKNLRVLAVVDSSGLYRSAAREIDTDLSVDANPFNTTKAPAEVQRFHTDVRFFDDAPSAERALRSKEVSQMLVIPADFLETGKLRRYARTNNLFSSAEDRPLTRWLVRNLLSGTIDSLRIERVARPLHGMDLYTLNKQGEWELKDDRREVFDFLLPLAFGMLLGLTIVTGGQYLLQGLAEEKESRILESLLCTMTSEELLAGKLIGLGGAGLTLVAAWVALGMGFGGPAAIALKLRFSPLLMAAGLSYFLLGYLFYASLMTGIGAITNNMREAQQFAFMFTFANFAPFIMLTSIIGHPDGGLAVGLSLFPPTAATTMMMRLAIPGSNVPLWQLGLSIALLGGAAWLAVNVAARIFRVGLLMYGKTPNLPEIMRWMRASSPRRAIEASSPPRIS